MPVSCTEWQILGVERQYGALNGNSQNVKRGLLVVRMGWNLPVERKILAHFCRSLPTR